MAKEFSFGDLSKIFEGMLMNTLTSHEERLVANDTIGEITIDTCDTFDAGFETAICREATQHWVIVSYWPDREAAANGHKAWCDIVQNWIDAGRIPEDVYSVQLESYERL